MFFILLPIGVVVHLFGIVTCINSGLSKSKSTFSMLAGFLIVLMAGADFLYTRTTTFAVYRTYVVHQADDTSLLTIRMSEDRGATETIVDLSTDTALQTVSTFLREHRDEYEPVGILLKRQK